MHWDIFCRVIDNHGDLGVCWRLAADLASRGETVRLWVDDPIALHWLAPDHDRTTPGVFDEFKAAVQVHGEIMECHLVAGGFDYLLKLRVADMPAYRDFAGRVLWQLPGVRETRTYAVMEEVKETTRLLV